MSTTSEPTTTSADQPESAESLRAERDAWRRRAEEAEAIAERLADELVELRRRQPDALPLFEETDDVSAELGVSPDGSDPRILPMVVAAVAVVMTMVALLSVINNGVFSVVTAIMVLIAAGLWWGAYESRSTPAKVSFVRSVVLVEERDHTHRFDLRERTTRVDIVGEPGESKWRAYLSAPGVEDQTLDGRMVDAAEFVALCRTWQARGA